MAIFFGLTGPQFLVFYAIVIAAAVAASFQYTEYCKRQLPKPQGHVLGLDPYELAFLRNLEKGLVNAVITKLLATKFLQASSSQTGHIERGKNYKAKLPKRKQKPAQQLAEEAERAILDTLKEDTPTSVSMKSIVTELKYKSDSIFDKYKERLTDNKLLVIHRASTSVLLCNIVLTMIVIGYGIARMMVGLSNKKPVGFLVVLMIIAFVCFYMCLVKARELEGPDQSIVDHYKTSKDRSLVASKDPQMVTWAVSLYGPLVLAGAVAHPDVATAFKGEWMTTPSYGGSSSSCSSCGSSCGGGCGGGCGGCGGCGG